MSVDETTTNMCTEQEFFIVTPQPFPPQVPTRISMLVVSPSLIGVLHRHTDNRAGLEIDGMLGFVYNAAVA